MTAIAQPDAAIRLATMVVPVAVYFLILGVLNSRRHPQLLSARTDFFLLLGALSPLGICPAIQLASASPLALAAVAACGLAGLAYLSPQRGSWVIYNLSPADARQAIADALATLGGQPLARPDGFDLAGRAGRVEVRSFPLLRNTTVRLRGGDRRLTDEVEQALSAGLASMPAEGSLMATALLLVATGMLAAPVTLMAQRAVQIVRVLTDLLY